MPDHSRDLLYLLHDTARLLRVEADKRAQRIALRELISAGLDPDTLRAATDGLIRMKVNILAVDRDDEKEVA